MKHKHLRFSRSVAFKWIISYSVIMIIPLIVSAIIYLQTKQIVEYEIERAGNAILKQMQNTVDSEINQAEKLAMQLSIHSGVNKYLSLTPGAERASSFQIYQIRQELSKYKSANDFIDGIYLYSSNLDRVLTDETYTDSETFYAMNNKMIGLSYQEWLSQLNGETAGREASLPFIEFKRWEQKVVMMKPFASATASNGQKGMLVLPLNGSKIHSMLKNVDWVNNGDVYITDDHNQVLFRNNEASPQQPMPDAEAGGETAGTSFQDIAGTENMVSFIDSDNTNWKYISVFPSSVFWEKARQIRNLNLLGLFISFLIGAVVISYFARKNYNPVRELVHMFSPSADEQTQRVLDEFSFIRESALATIRERDDVNSRQFRQLRVLQTYYLSQLLRGQAENGLSLEEVARVHHFQWDSGYFAVLLFYIQSGGEEGPSPSLSNFIVSNIIMDFTGPNHGLSFTEMDGMLAAVMNINTGRSGRWKEDIEEALSQTLEFIQRKYGLQIAMAGSEQLSGMGSLHQGYLQALEAQEYRLVLEEDTTVWYGDIEQQQTDYYLTINDEVVFINLVKSGDFGKASAMVEEILGRFFGSQVSIELVRYAMIDLSSSIMKAVPQEMKRSKLWEEWRPMKRLLACSTRADFRNELTELIQLACSQASEKLASNSGIGDQVSAYVQDHYADINLSVSMIGAHFGITPQYVSRLFKEQSGQGLHDYISQVRTAEAKKLLQQGVTIEEISSRVGFSSSSAFIRVFKKYEGITPGRFKALQ
ncbi:MULTISPECIES: AraC family transcriptional regulator [unclassified Paenibacillus]|uniref:AraC family transcriptional regulator n=1 Tax=unclassified Paenibacillus TaxID=185978 RepID=UPI0003E1DFDC|nr:MULTISPECIES: AraC family transcriptional regulator [unclassified Paenibacillus]ETT44389.1 AraC family transcriptional regulator [Paenibacillus sp. FSL R7-269]OMF99917.1 AraC family transcriptional regulator [Paenibacillus sp. FSL R7-0337]